jgi:hypothetical protein
VFINNKYTRLYYKIIQNAKSKNRIKRRSTHKNYIYYENHHTIPRSLGGTDNDDNLVLLTPREHFLCHYLLCKMISEKSNEWNKLVRAFTFMYSSTSNHKRYVNSRLYESARKNIGKIMSESQSGNGNSQFGKIWVSHIKNKHTCKIDKNSLNEYLNNGYIQQRIVCWDRYTKEENIKKEKLKQKINDLNQSINLLTIEKESLFKELALLEGLEPSTSSFVD